MWWRTSQTVEYITEGPTGKQKQIGLEKYLKFDSVKFLVKQLLLRTLKMPKYKQTLTFYTDYNLHQWIDARTKSNMASKLHWVCVSKSVKH